MSRPPSVAALLPAAWLTAALGGAALAQGTPRSIGECERLKNDLAYNQCLAMFGPEARMITGGDGAPSRAPPASAAAMAAIPYAAEPGQAEVPQVEEPVTAARSGYGRRGGRQSASFDVGGGGGAGGRRWSRWRRSR